MRVVIILILVATLAVSRGQQKICGTAELEKLLLKADPNRADQIKQRDLYNQQHTLSITPYSGVPDTVDVVVHIINLGGPIGSYNNPGDSSIQAMINVLNKCFNATYQDQYGLNQSLGIDIGIYFRLATRDSNCHPTTGIERIDASLDTQYVTYGAGVGGTLGITQQKLTQLGYWDNTKYYNIWIVNKLWGGIYGGVALVTPGSKNINDGILLPYYAVNNNTIAHETGHYLGLNHTFGGSVGTDCPISTTNCLIDDDGICDTDPHPQNTGGCVPTNINACTNRAYGNVVYNHMSYSCPSIFTVSQKDRMRNTLLNFRASLLNKNMCPPFLYTFTGNGAWKISSNWSNNAIPPDVLTAGSQIVIAPAGNGKCILSNAQFISYGASLTVQAGKKLEITAELRNVTDGPFLSLEDIELLDSIGIATPDLQDKLGGFHGKSLNKPNGVTQDNAQLVSELIDKMWSNSISLSNQKAVIHLAEGTNKPEHVGYAYRYGSNDEKDLNQRHNADNGDALHNSQIVFGTDCTGFLINLLINSGVHIPVCSVGDFGPTLNYALRHSTLYKNVRLENKGHLPKNETQSGDFISWDSHDGIIYQRSDQSRILFNSNGNPFPETYHTKDKVTKKIRTSPEEQAHNLTSDRGIHALDFNDVLTFNFFKGKYYIQRLESVDLATPAVTVTAAAPTLATASCSILYSGKDKIIIRGFELSRNAGFTSIEKMIPGTGTNDFTANISDLIEGTQYWVRSYVSFDNDGSNKYYSLGKSFIAADPSFTIGQVYDGGIIFYLDDTKKHGLMCATVDQGTASWDAYPFDVNNYQNYAPQITFATSTSLLTGFSNTTVITGIIGTGFNAAGLCKLYRDEKNHDDWYLPSKVELNVIYQNLVVPGIITPSTLFSSYYWSSSEIGSKEVWSQKFDDGQQVNFAWKNNTMNVRAVRAF